MKCYNLQWVYLITGILLTEKSVSTCNLPTSWDSLWYDSTVTGDLTITRATLTVSGWTRTIFTTNTLTDWLCVLEDTSNNYLVFRSNSFTDTFVTYYAYLCVKWTKVTDYSYYYYIMADGQSNAGNERVVVHTSNVSPTTSNTCSTSTFSIEEFHMMVKQGQVTNVKQYCPPPFLGTFTYTYNDGSSTYCGSSSNWNVCTTRDTMTFDYTACSHQIVFTNEGEVNCVANISSGSVYYTYIFNPGTVDNTNYYRFSCIVVTTSGSNVVCSISPNSCQSGQTATAVPTNGAKATLSAIATCPFESTQTTTSMTSSTTTGSSDGATINIGLIAGLTIGLFVFIYFLANVVMVLCKKYLIDTEEVKKQSSKNPESDIERNRKLKPIKDRKTTNKINGISKIHALPPIK